MVFNFSKPEMVLTDRLPQQRRILSRKNLIFGSRISVCECSSRAYAIPTYSPLSTDAHQAPGGWEAQDGHNICRQGQTCNLFWFTKRNHFNSTTARIRFVCGKIVAIRLSAFRISWLLKRFLFVWSPNASIGIQRKALLTHFCCVIRFFRQHNNETCSRRFGGQVFSFSRFTCVILLAEYKSYNTNTESSALASIKWNNNMVRKYNIRVLRRSSEDFSESTLCCVRCALNSHTPPCCQWSPIVEFVVFLWSCAVRDALRPTAPVHLMMKKHGHRLLRAGKID